MAHNLFGKQISIFCFIVIISILCWSDSTQNVYAVSKTGLIVPLYSYPGNDWNTLITEKTKYPSIPIVAIINPDNGPGTKDTNYVYGIQKLQSSGIQVIGYVYTANIDYNTITKYIDEYKSWYNVNGIFFDQMSNVKGNETFYASLTNYSKSVGLELTIGNPGIDTLPSYVGTVDNIVIYDNPGLPRVSSFEGWHKNFTKSNFSFISYGVNDVNKTYVANMSRLVQYMYISNSTLPNPFSSLPRYIDNLVNMLDAQQNNVFVTVNASSVAGKSLTGLWTVVTSGKNSTTGFTPLTFDAVYGNNYTVTMSNFRNYTFDHWGDGTQSNSITITPVENFTLIAYYGKNHTMPTKPVTPHDKEIPKHEPNEHDYGYTAPKPSHLPNTGSISATISYANGDRAYPYGVSLKIYQDVSQTVFKNMDSISSNPFTIDSLSLGHTYKIEVYANGMYSDIEYVQLDQSTKNSTPKNLVLHLSPPGGLLPNVFYNDGMTPISNAIVYVKDQSNKTWGTDYTDAQGKTTRFWLEPTIMNHDYYTIDVKIGQHLSYSYWPVFLYPGSGRDIKITTTWPPVVSGLVTVKAYDEQSKLLSSKNSSFAVDLLDNNNNLIAESKLNYRGEANFSNLKVGDYVFYLVDYKTGEKWSQSKITIDGTKKNFSITKENLPLGMSGNQTVVSAN